MQQLDVGKLRQRQLEVTKRVVAPKRVVVQNSNLQATLDNVAQLANEFWRGSRSCRPEWLGWTGAGFDQERSGGCITPRLSSHCGLRVFLITLVRRVWPSALTMRYGSDSPLESAAKRLVPRRQKTVSSPSPERRSSSSLMDDESDQALAPLPADSLSLDGMGDECD